MGIYGAETSWWGSGETFGKSEILLQGGLTGWQNGNFVETEGEDWLCASYWCRICTQARMNCLKQVTVAGRKCEVWKLGKQLK
jgi:hypothetical protein